MVQVRGTVHDVSDNPDRVEKIIVRAVEPRMHGSTYITEEPTQFPVVDGVLDFNVLPGPCVVAFLRNHGATTYEKLLVPDVAEATFRECRDAAALAEEGTKSALEEVVRQIQEELNKAVPLVDEVRNLRTEVNESKTVVDGYVKSAKKSADDAASSESKAKTSETKASSSAASAETHQKSASDSAAAAKTSETNAASSESKAKTSETNAGASATAAATSEGEAKDHADRAEQATDLTSLRNEVTQQISDLVDGAPEDLDTIREVAEYAQANRDVTDQLNAAIGNKANKNHTHTTADITDATDRLGRVSDYYTANKLVRTNANGQLTVYTTSVTEDSSVANKNYVDIEVAKKADKSHTHAWSSISERPDIPVTDVGYRIRWADHTPDLYPAGVSVSMSATEQGWGTALAASNPDYVDDGFVVILTIRNGRYAQSAYQMVFSYTVLARPVYIRKYNGEESGWSNFRKLSDDGHKHTIEQVTGLQGELDSRPSAQIRWSYCGRADSSASNWVFTPIPLTEAPSVTNGNQRITPGVSGIWEIHLKCSDPDRKVEIFTSKGSVQGTGSCFTIVNLDASDYITSYRYGAADGTKIALDMTKLD